MSEIRDYLEAHPELEALTPEQLEKFLEQEGAKAEAEYEAWKEEEGRTDDSVINASSF